MDSLLRTYSISFLLLFLFCTDRLVGANDGVSNAPSDSGAVLPTYQQEIEPLLKKYCFECHAEGTHEGNVALDQFEASPADNKYRKLWWGVLKNVRADIMPPHQSDRPNLDEKQKLLKWIQRYPLEINPDAPDPGRVVLRRLNRVEYRNTIRDLVGIEYDTQVEFPPDDTGHGFDTVADALSLSPLLFEKYLQAADEIVQRAVPQLSRIMPRRTLSGNDFKPKSNENGGEKLRGNQLSFYKPAEVYHSVKLEHSGEYEVTLELEVNGGFDFEPGRCHIVFSIDETKKLDQEFAWEDDKTFRFTYPVALEKGSHEFGLTLKPLVTSEEKSQSLRMRIQSVKLAGPMDQTKWANPENYSKFFPRPDPPNSSEERRVYASQIIRDFATRAFRRPVDDANVDKFVNLAASVYEKPNRTFEQGISRAFTAILASPRFLFRFESPVTSQSGELNPLIDEYALAARLSYFFWSTTPDAELIQLAEKGELRANLSSQVQRLMKDRRFDACINNFVGQWLQTRDLESISIDPLSAIGAREEYDQLREQLFARGRRSREPRPEDPPEIAAKRARFNELRGIRDALDAKLRKAMRRETEMLFEHVVREDKSLLDLVDGRYTFLNEALAKHYGIEGVSGEDMRRVELPENSPRGGVLTQASYLMVTSNPTRTSPVKRGLFILDNILGTPAPPAPAAVPELEASKKAITDHEPTLREILEIHRQEPLCNACHQRFDPLGLALENFNALGMWRDTEQGKPIEVAGALITGESFADIRELKQILRNQRRADFYRCVSQKMLTYALGRGLEDYDELTIDQMVAALEANDGRFSTLINSVVNSAPFQRQRAIPATSQTTTPDRR